jgi:hypothetical protein
MHLGEVAQELCGTSQFARPHSQSGSSNVTEPITSATVAKSAVVMKIGSIFRLLSSRNNYGEHERDYGRHASSGGCGFYVLIDRRHVSLLPRQAYERPSRRRVALLLCEGDGFCAEVTVAFKNETVPLTKPDRQHCWAGKESGNFAEVSTSLLGRICEQGGVP